MLHLVLACFCFICFTSLENVKGTNIKAVFPSNPSNLKRFPRLILDGTLPNMNELTICHWVNAHTIKSKGIFIASYAHGQAADEILTGVGPVSSNRTKLILNIANQTFSTWSDKFKVGKWHHLCFTWSSGDGQVNAYLDGESAGKGRNILPRGNVRSGGVLMFGQDQDVYNGKFDLEESWEGYIADVQIWDEALKHEQITSMARCQMKLEGNVFAWMKTPVIAMEGVGLSAAQICRGNDQSLAKRHIIVT